MIQDPLVVSNYQMLKETGLLDYIAGLRVENRELESLLEQAYEIFRKESVEELVNYIIGCFSDKFVPADLVFILNHGIMFNRIKTLVYKNLKKIDSELSIESLEPYEHFFRINRGTSSYSVFRDEISNKELLEPFSGFEPKYITPINGRSGIYGIIVFGPKVLGQEYSGHELDYIDRITGFTSVGIQNNIHYEHSVREPKTGLYNHNFFVRRVEEEIARVRRTGNVFSIIILDIDYFKKFNDTYGHIAGDEIILELAGKIVHVMREQDIPSRFGGEEFTVLLPATGSKDAWTAAERLRTAVEKMKINYEGRNLSITISLGIATYDNSSGEDENIIDRADTALYRSKQEGRNRTSFLKRHD